MAKAIIQGLITKEKFLPNQIFVTDADQKYLEHLKANVPFFQVKYSYVLILLRLFLSTIISKGE